jgi:hypothetical protein
VKLTLVTAANSPRPACSEKTKMTDIKTREAAAIAAALLLARLAQLRFARNSNAPVCPPAHYLHSGAAQLLLVPCVEEPRRDQLDEAMTAHDADALLVQAIGRNAEDIGFRAVMRAPLPFWSEPASLWLGGDAPAHLVPASGTGPVFALMHVGLRGCEVQPWVDEADRDAGLELGRRELVRVLEGR